MNVVQAIQDYVTKMISNIPGMKVLLLDKETTGIVSMVYSRTLILQKEVYLFEKIDNTTRELMAHLKCIAFLRPTLENQKLLEQELRNPKYGEYHLFFANTVRNDYIERLAEADEHEVAQQLQEYFGDYFAINTDLFSLNLPQLVSLHQQDWRAKVDRTVDGLASILLSLKKQPSIRYVQKSEIGHKVCTELSKRIQTEPGLFDFRKQDTPPLLLIMDRREDPVTPLLTQWTFQAMVHELIGITNGRVDLSFVKDIKPDMKEIVLNPDQDQFYKQHMFANFGDLGAAVKALVDEFQVKAKSNEAINSLEAIKKFVENFPAFKQQSGNVTKHVTLMTELSHLIDSRHLLRVSELEQSLANTNDRAMHLRNVKDCLAEPDILPDDKVRLALLYVLRYEDQVQDAEDLKHLLQTANVEREKIYMIDTIKEMAGQRQRTADLFGTKSVLGIKQIGAIFRPLKGVENIYTEHKPQLKEIIDQLLANKLPENYYPFFSGSRTRDRPQDIIIFFVGGVTYEEALIVHEFNSQNVGSRIILGGTHVHNSKSFLQDLEMFRTFSSR
eukprot:TRINITY_DN10010_c0_g1_i1.p1 TRINITY_DN10010_c0_g1~~TRINITY_DN10010_c0_g1_i1.p1  ORF type:complete len:557 (-),score=183.72 TRINITY_DN10010_c0_g1_i1:46-1716(-)